MMKVKSVKTLLSVFLAFCMLWMALPVAALPAEVKPIADNGEYRYKVLDEATKTCAITEYIGAGGDIQIPSTIQNYTVTMLASHAFFSCSSVTTVTIPSSVAKIESCAFEACYKLKAINVDEKNEKYCSLDGVLFTKNKKTLVSAPSNKQGMYTIPDGVSSIADVAFGYNFLLAVRIPDSVTSFGNDLFRGSRKMTILGNKASGAEAYAKETGWPFVDITGKTEQQIQEVFLKIKKEQDFFGRILDETAKTCALYYNGLGGDVTLPSELNGYTVTHIAAHSFSYVDTLRAVSIPNSVRLIEDNAFEGCTGLTSVQISNGTESIGCCAFSNCNSLTSVLLPNSVTKLAFSAFEICSNLRYIFIPNSVTHIEENVFAGCENLTIYGYAGSAAEIYASRNDIPFQAISQLTAASNGTELLLPPEVLRPDTTVQSAERSVGDKQTEYEISLQADGASYQPAGNVQVSLPVPVGMNPTEVQVYQKNENGTYIDMHAVVQEGKLVFITQELGAFCVTSDFLDVLPGDIAEDGNINLTDYDTMLKRISCFDTDILPRREFYAGDLNQDGAIDAFDAALLDHMLLV